MSLADDQAAQIAAMQTQAVALVQATTTVSTAVGPNATVATQLAAMNTALTNLQTAAGDVGTQATAGTTPSGSQATQPPT